jgi:Tfp pilus assembly protein PilE
MVVVVILAVLGALVVPKILENVDKARVTRAQSDIRAIQTALDLYRLDNFKYPTTEQGLQAFRHCRVRKHGVSQNCVRLACQHRELNRTHEFACLRPKSRESENAVTVCVDERLHEPSCLTRCLGAQYGTHFQPRDADLDALAVRFTFGPADPGQLGIGEHAVGNQPVACRAVPAGEIVADDPEVVEGRVRELWMF